MKSFFIIQLTIVSFFLASLCQAQPEKILEVSIFPSNPTATDSVHAILESRSSGGSIDFGYAFLRTNDSFLFSHCFAHTPHAAPRFYRDTFNLGKLLVGTYTLKYTSFTSSSYDSCTYDEPIDSTVTFEVTKNTSVPGLRKPTIQVYPNPASETIHTSFAQPTEVCIYDALGRKQKAIKFFDAMHPIDIRELRKGIYLLYFPEFNQALKVFVN